MPKCSKVSYFKPFADDPYDNITIRDIVIHLGGTQLKSTKYPTNWMTNTSHKTKEASTRNYQIIEMIFKDSMSKHNIS
jgi:hypothetical protein